MRGAIETTNTRWLLILLVFLGSFCSPAAAQRTVQPTPPGDDVTTAGPIALPHETTFEPWAHALRTPAASRNRLPLASERAPRFAAASTTRDGALWGLFLGTSLGIIAGPFAAADIPMDTGPAVALFGAVGGAVGILSGAAIGRVLEPIR